MTDNKCKKVIIENKKSIRYDAENNVFKIDSTTFNYYTDISIKLNGDSCYYIVFWGDRDSWLWDFKLDKNFSIDIPYNRYKGKNIDKDVEIINILNSVK
jgi:hypothetical protein